MTSSQDLNWNSQVGEARCGSWLRGKLVSESPLRLRHIHIHEQVKADSFQIFCDLEKEMQPEHCGAAGVLLAIFRDCWSVASSYGGDYNAERNSIRNATIEKLWIG